LQFKLYIFRRFSFCFGNKSIISHKKTTKKEEKP